MPSGRSWWKMYAVRWLGADENLLGGESCIFSDKMKHILGAENIGGRNKLSKFDDVAADAGI